MMHKSLWLLSAGAVALVGAIPLAHAQDAAPQAAVDTESVDIIVTATRRASPLSDVPIAVSAVGQQAMQNSGANDIRALNQLAPSLLVSSTGTEANGSARIRGIGTVGDNPGLESSVAVFIDGVYRSRTGAGLNDLGEIERVEVLRGPQGTLFGRNASAGLINIVSKAPEFTLGGMAEATYGNYDYWRLAGRITGPIAKGIALSLDGVWSKRDGFYDLVDTSGNKVGDTNDRDRYFLRGQALIEPSDALSIRLIGDYTNRDESCCGAAYVETRERRPATGGGYSTAPFNRIGAILAGQGSVFPADPYDRELTITEGRDYVSKLKDWGVSGEINYDLGGAKLTSITAYRDYKSRDYGDYDYSGADLLYRDPNTYRQFKTFTQELRAQGSAFNEALDWLVGGYYANEKLTLEDNIRFGADYGRFAACRLMAGAGVNSNFTAAQLAACGSGLATSALIGGTQANLNAGLTAALINAGLPAGVAAAQAGAISTGLGNGLRALPIFSANQCSQQHGDKGRGICGNRAGMAQLGFLARHAGQLAIAHHEATGQRRDPVRRIHPGGAAFEFIVDPSDGLATGHAVVIHARHHHGKHIAGVDGAVLPPVAIAGKDILCIETAACHQTLPQTECHAYRATIALAGSKAIQAAADALRGERFGLNGWVGRCCRVHLVLPVVLIETR